ncbi:MAG: peptidylprolyl isomerase [Solobacterium sp.]|nr:peptidylprolyl isomerase [Solobacterium sp.]
MKQTFRMICVLCMCMLVLAGCGKNTAGNTPAAEIKEGGIHHAEIIVKDYGTIKLELDGDTAPITVKNFLTLAQSGYYDGKKFHRIIDGFMIQGGAGGPAASIKGEFRSNGVENDIKHVPGVISMARAKSNDSASSQFFIMVGTADWLDGEYAAFGHVTEGLEIAKKIASDAKPIDNNGTIKDNEQPVIETVKVID